MNQAFSCLTALRVKLSITQMTKIISKVGNSQGIIFDSAFMDLAHLKVGDQLNVTMHEGGAIVLTPLRSSIGPTKAAATARRVIKKNSELFRRLA